jgi:hypothetical protein
MKMDRYAASLHKHSIFSMRSVRSKRLKRSLSRRFAKFPIAYTITAACLALTISGLWFLSSSAQANPAFIRQVRVLEARKTGLSKPVGIIFSKKSNALLVLDSFQMDGKSPHKSELIRLTPFGHQFNTFGIAAAIQDPINMTLDEAAGRLLIYQKATDQILEVGENSDGNFNQAFSLDDAGHLNLKHPEGMTIDPSSGTLYILDVVGPRNVSIESWANGEFESAMVSEVNLQPTGMVDLHGLAFDPTTDHLHSISVADKKLYELTLDGQIATL